MNNLSEFLIRVSAFARKEVAGIIRQPRLVAILILGPFLILLIFGLGYTNQERTLNTIIVIPTGSTMEERITGFADRLRGVTLVDFVASETEPYMLVRGTAKIRSYRGRSSRDRSSGAIPS